MKKNMRRAWSVVLALTLILGSAYAKAGENALHVLIIGVDSSAGDRRGRSDTMMLVSVDPAMGEIRLVSFLRDLYVSIPGVGKTRLNAAYHYGGETLLKETLAKNFGVRVDRTVTVQFSMLADLVDQLGGIELEIAEKEREHLNEIIADYNADYGLSGGWIERAGKQLLNGKQSLCYSRIRQIDSDFQRTSRQQKVISAMLEKLGGMSKWEMIKLAVRNISRVETDMGFSDITALAPMMAQMENLQIQTAHVPFAGAFSEETANGMMVLKPDLEVCRRKLAEFLEPNENGNG